MNTDSETRTLRPQTPVIPSEEHPFTVLYFLVNERKKQERKEIIKQLALFNLALYAASSQHVTSQTKKIDEVAASGSDSKLSSQAQSNSENVIPNTKMKVGAVKTKATTKAAKLSAETQFNLANLGLLTDKLKKYLQNHQATNTCMPDVCSEKEPKNQAQDEIKKSLDPKTSRFSTPERLPTRRLKNQFFEPALVESGILKLPKAQHNRPSPESSSASSVNRHLATISIQLPKINEFLNKLPLSEKTCLEKTNYKK
jgi:hypothetical protein